MSENLPQALEQCLLTAWPSLKCEMMAGWAVRFANGYSSRANSASAIQQDAALDDALLGQMEEQFRLWGIAPCVRLTPVAAASVKPLLKRNGYAAQDVSETLIAPLAGDWPIDVRVAVPSVADTDWLEGVCRWQGETKRAPDKLRAIVSRLAVPAGYATLAVDGQPVAFGLCVLDGELAELGCIMVDPAQRGKGFGRVIVTSLMGWAASQGGARAFLQVDAKNLPALALYYRLGFTLAYRYSVMVKAQKT